MIYFAVIDTNVLISAMLKRPSIPISAVQTLLNSIIHRGIWQNPEPTYENLPDPKDLIFYETLLAARKKFPAYLVNGNLKHFTATDFIVSPHTMLDLSNTNNEK